MIRRLFLKLRRRRRLERDLEAEMAFHREMAAAGGNPMPLGNAGLIQEQAFDLWRFNLVENLWRDLALAVRTLRKSRGFVLTALLSLGLGIGVNTAMFSLAVEFLLSEPSVRDARTLVHVRQGGDSHFAPAVLESIRRSELFEDVAGENEESFINFNDGTETQRIFACQATKNYFTTLGVPLALGRGWNEKDANEVVVLHPRFWHARLGGDPDIVGKAIRLDGRLYTVLGVLPDNYRSLIGYGYAPDLFVPRYIEGTILAGYARLKPGMNVGQLQAALPALSQQLEREFPDRDNMDRQIRATAIAGLERLPKQKESMAVSLFFVILLALVGLVLIIACVNVASLLLARAEVRRQELAVRLALGASRMRLLQQLLAESLVLSLAGAGLGFLFALGVAKALAAIPLPFPVPIRLHIDPDWRVASYAALLAVVSAVASGLAPAWQSLKESLAAGMHRERKLRLRRALVVAQIAVSFIVLTTAALFLENLARGRSMGPGFDLRHTVRAEVYLPPREYSNGRAIQLYVRRALDGLRAIHGVDGAAASRTIPFNDSTNFRVPIKFSDTGETQQARFNWNAVTADFFSVMDIPVVRGRAFTAQDLTGPRVAVINEEFARRYLGNRDPVGVPVIWRDAAEPVQIVGVVRGTKVMSIGEDPRAQLYEPMTERVSDQKRIEFVVRSATPPAAQVAAIRQSLRAAEPAAGVEVETMFSAIGFAFLPSQVGAGLMGGIGVLGLILAIIGLYGVLAYSVARRTREIGIRMAIGASPGHVSKIVAGEFARLLATGIGAGLALTLVVTRPLAMFFVPGLSTRDPASLAAVIVVLAITGAVAALGPVRRALRVDPLRCLRYE